MNRACAFITLCLVVASGLAQAHEMRPAYLNLREERPGEYSVLWKTPMRGDARLDLTPQFSDKMAAASEVHTTARSGAAIQQWILHTSVLRGQTVNISGIEGTMTDALVHIEFIDGTTWTTLLTPRAPIAVIPQRNENAETPSARDRAPAPLAQSIAIWGVMCAAAAVARSRRRAVAIGAYAVGLAAGFLLICTIVELFRVA